MTNILPEHVLSAIRERRQRLAKSDCQRERPFLVVRTTAATFAESLRREAEEELKLCGKRMDAEAKLYAKLSCSHAKSAHYLRCLANRIEMEGSDAS